MKLPEGFEFIKASGWWALHHIRHDCGWQTGLCYDTCKDEDRATIRQIVYSHECED